LAASVFYYHLPWRIADRVRDSFLRTNRRLWSEARRAIDRSYHLAKILCDAENTRLFFDSTKNGYQIKFLASDPRIDLKVVALVRDGRGVMSSMIRRENWTPERAVRGWVRSWQMIKRSTRYLPKQNVFWLRLEDLCRDPNKVIKELQVFCGIPAALDLADLTSVPRHIIGNQMRHSFDGKIKLDESWRDNLSEKDLALFERKAGRLNRSLGYK
jgi:hypothetical protein